MIRYEYDDGGREAAGYKGRAGDCVCRAFTILAGKDYRECYRLLGVANATHGYARSARGGLLLKVYEGIYFENGLARVDHLKRRHGGRFPTFTEAYETYGNCIVRIAKHVAAIVDGALRDTDDIRTYWWLNDHGSHFVEEERDRKAIAVYTWPHHGHPPEG